MEFDIREVLLYARDLGSIVVRIDGKNAWVKPYGVGVLSIFRIPFEVEGLSEPKTFILPSKYAGIWAKEARSVMFTVINNQPAVKVVMPDDEFTVFLREPVEGDVFEVPLDTLKGIVKLQPGYKLVSVLRKHLTRKNDVIKLVHAGGNVVSLTAELADAVIEKKMKAKILDEELLRQHEGFEVTLGADYLKYAAAAVDLFAADFVPIEIVVDEDTGSYYALTRLSDGDREAVVLYSEQLA